MDKIRHRGHQTNCGTSFSDLLLLFILGDGSMDGSSQRPYCQIRNVLQIFSPLLSLHTISNSLSVFRSLSLSLTLTTARQNKNTVQRSWRTAASSSSGGIRVCFSSAPVAECILLLHSFTNNRTQKIFPHHHQYISSRHAAARHHHHSASASSIALLLCSLVSDGRPRVAPTPPPPPPSPRTPPARRKSVAPRSLAAR